MYDLHRGLGKERVGVLEQNVVPEGLKPERLTLHERHMHRRASVSLELSLKSAWDLWSPIGWLDSTPEMPAGCRDAFTA